jgi:DNA topoisomerase II
MPIWSLTQERVDKLLKQIGDKEVEIDDLIKLTPKDIWNKDLDEFLDEWHAVLSDEAKTRKKAANMGRRTSFKLGIGAKSKGKKRKNDSEDESDSDFAVSKAKKPAEKPSLMLSYLNKAAAAKPSASANLISTFSNGDSSKAPPKDEDDDIIMLDGASDPNPAATTSKVKKPVKPAPSVNKAKPAVSAPRADDYDEDDVFAAVAKEEPAPTARVARAAAKKPIKYVLSDGSDEESGDSFLDVSHMVKGIGSSTESLVPARPLFSESAPRPSSSNAKSLGRLPLRIDIESEDDVDQTDFTKLIPQPSPQRRVARTAIDDMLSDDDDVLLSKPKVAKAAGKQTVKPTAKPAAKPAAKRAPAPKAAVSSLVAEKKATKLSPAAKAYLMKQEKLKTTGSKLGSKKLTSKFDSDDDDADAIANNLLSDVDEPVAVSKPKAKAKAPAAGAGGRGRPGRAAASKPAKYVVSDDDSEDDGSEASFDDDSA